MMQVIKIGTRGSPLALWQANKVASLLTAAHPDIAPELTIIKTSGDRIQDRPLADIGGKGLFVKEIEEALLAGEVDLAVHSMKDMPTQFPNGLHIGAVLKREEYRDALVSRQGSFQALKPGAVIGTSSLRRRAEASRRRPDLRFLDCRGNVDTRLRKLDEGQYDAIVLSAAGLERLGLEAHASEYLDWIPAVGQGIICIETRTDDARVNALLTPLHYAETAALLSAERAFMTVLEGSCQVALGCLAERETDQSIIVRGFWVHPQTGLYSEATCEGALQDAPALGERLAHKLKIC